jgi:glycerol-3-phosphate dehydrogenase subunit B
MDMAGQTLMQGARNFPDLIVIGAGLAGLSAALAAAQAGLRVRAIAKGMGATHWHTGAIDLLGYLPGNESPMTTPLDALAALPTQHPYRMLGGERVASALAVLSAWLAGSELKFAGAATAGHNLLLPSALGVPRPTFLAPQAQLNGDLQRPEPILVVGFQGMRDFFPKLIAANLNRIGHPARAEFLSQDLLAPCRDRNTVHLAEILDAPAAHERLATVLKQLVQPGERIALPAILGLRNHVQTWTALQAQTGVPIFEIPTLPPSVPGIRLYHALCDRLLALGARVEVGMEAIRFTAERGVITSVQTAASARPLVHRSRAFLLATGGLLGGGFTSDHMGRFQEAIFNLPLTALPDHKQWFRHQFLHPDGHPVFSAGVPVDSQQQPVDGQGKVLYENLWAAGGVLAHTDPIRERSLEGLAIATGVAAAQSILNRLC